MGEVEEYCCRTVLVSSRTTDIILENVYLELNISAIIQSAVHKPHLSKWWGRSKK
jgi:hypothetical protein